MVKFSAALFIAIAISAPALAIPTEKEHVARELSENVYERGLDAEDLNLSVRDFYEGDLSMREVNDLVEREPFFGAIFSAVKAAVKIGKGAKKIHDAKNRHRRKRDLEDSEVYQRSLDGEVMERDFEEEFQAREVDHFHARDFVDVDLFGRELDEFYEREIEDLD